MQQKGTTIVPFSFYHMATDTLIQHIETLVNTMLADEPEYFLVQVKIKPVNNIKVFLDGDNGITIEKCVRFNRKLYKTIEELALFNEGDFSLELSSPGVSEPLKLIRQYTKNIGRFVEVLFIDGTAKEGKLMQVLEEDIMIESTEGKGKKAVTQQLVIPLISIKSITVQIKF
ncbi:LSm family protein [Limnovirga soli]|nr:ribosome maturation factor [Limnovirga soli]